MVPSPSLGQGWIVVHLDRLLKERGMTLTELAKRISLTQANVSILKTGKAKAIRFTTLVAICAELECQPGDLLSFEPKNSEAPTDASEGGVRIGAGNVVLTDAGQAFIAVIKVIRQETGAGLKTAKLIVDTAPSVVASGMTRPDAEALMVRLRAAGANAEII